ncbi:hypothetical protein ACH4NS_25425 [Streptomyces mutabilis]|uniref:effector-associated constant component EACC1 n=1 Tax=Streptomyces mutabilis TaxID=67332 RepID=UPI000A26635E|nr:hypothetical protein [Streptomyces sp. DH17]OSC72785.1 hypothetical protein B5181_02295 [Streptomyces sp. 4F]
MSQIDVRVAGAADPEEELRSLLRWLRADEQTGRALHGELRSLGPTDPEHMGTLLDVITLVVTGGLSAAQLVVSIDQWRAARRSRPRVVLRRGTVEIEVTGAEEATVRAVARLLDEERDDDGGSA